MKDILNEIFRELNQRIEAENLERDESGAAKISPVEILVLGQMTLLANEFVAKVLPLQRTGDLDAIIKGSKSFVQSILQKEILPKYNLVFESDNELIWIPPESQFDSFCHFRFVKSKLLDPESALVSKAVKAPQKNKILIIDAIASDLFPNLMKRIKKNGGNLQYFLEDEND